MTHEIHMPRSFPQYDEGWLAPACNKEFEGRENGALEIIYLYTRSSQVGAYHILKTQQVRHRTFRKSSYMFCIELGFSHVHRRKLCCFCFAVKS
jgi:hypothetical protein